MGTSGSNGATAAPDSGAHAIVRYRRVRRLIAEIGCRQDIIAELGTRAVSSSEEFAARKAEEIALER